MDKDLFAKLRGLRAEDREFLTQVHIVLLKRGNLGGQSAEK
jgi:hypothetical protein